jgi:7-carboxy-7-deazaguanine synthase
MTDNQTTIIQQELPVMESFYTLQGEGYHQGKAAYFIRLAGCDVGCVWCDVKDSWDALKHPIFTIEQIIQKGLQETKFQNPNSKFLNPILAVVTGGEPLMHDLSKLTKALHDAGFQTNIETSGSSPLTGEWDWICLSPKKFKAPLQEIIPSAHELKIVVFNHSDFNWAEKYATLVSPTCKLFLQPEWDKAAEITPAIINYIKANPKWELSLQIHKYINVP